MRRLLLAATLAALLLAPIAQGWSWPADGQVLRPFVFDTALPFAGGQHRGIDIGSTLGAAVGAPAAGTVTFAGPVPSSGRSVTVTTAVRRHADAPRVDRSLQGRGSRRGRRRRDDRHERRP